MKLSPATYLCMQVVELDDYFLSAHLATLCDSLRQLDDLLQGIRTLEPLPTSTPPVVLRSSKPPHIRLPTLFSSRNSKPSNSEHRAARSRPTKFAHLANLSWDWNVNGNSRLGCHQPHLARIPTPYIGSHCLIARFIWPSPPVRYIHAHTHNSTNMARYPPPRV